MTPNAVQQFLETLYDVRTDHRVEDYLLTRPEAAAAAAAGSGLGKTAEALLVVEAEGNLDLALFLDDALLKRLRADNPASTLHDGNLEDFLTVLEGVSHFLYLVWNAPFGRAVSQLEMELQAEVDKFITARILVSRQYQEVSLQSLWEVLFRRFRLRPDVIPERARRYYRAHHLAARYCRRLATPERRPAGTSLLAELRRFYRMTQEKKIRHIESSSV